MSIRIPIEVTTKLSVEQARSQLLKAMQKPNRFSIMAHRQMVGTASQDRIVLRRGTIRGWSSSRNYGEFRGNFVEQSGSVKLKGQFVELAGSWSRFVVACVATLVSVIAFFWVGLRNDGAAFVGPAVFATLLLLAVVVILLVLSGGSGAGTRTRRPGRSLNPDDRLRGAGQNRRNVLAEAEFLTQDLKRILKG